MPRIWCSTRRSGIILGGRLGYVLFYAPQHVRISLGIFKLWDGGMSFHGGVIGTTIGIILFARRHKLDWLRVHDYVACCAPFGLFFGRIANFVNGELWGKPADASLPWAIVFHGTPNDVARHPSQLYEAGLEGIVLFAILWFAFWRTKARYDPGKLVGLFILFYGLFRYIVEFFREPDSQYADSPILGVAGLHMGQLLCLPMILGGVYLMMTAAKRRQRSHADRGRRRGRVSDDGSLARPAGARDHDGGADPAVAIYRRGQCRILRPRAIRWGRRATSPPRPKSARCSAS